MNRSHRPKRSVLGFGFEEVLQTSSDFQWLPVTSSDFQWLWGSGSPVCFQWALLGDAQGQSKEPLGTIWRNSKENSIKLSFTKCEKTRSNHRVNVSQNRSTDANRQKSQEVWKFQLWHSQVAHAWCSPAFPSPYRMLQWHREALAPGKSTSQIKHRKQTMRNPWKIYGKHIYIYIYEAIWNNMCFISQQWKLFPPHRAIATVQDA